MATPWIGYTQHPFGIDGAYNGKLEQELWLAVGVGADVQEKTVALRCLAGENRRNGWALDAPDAARRKRDAASAPPELPAVKKASASRRLTSSMATTIEQSFLAFTAAAGCSCISSTLAGVF